MSDLDASYRDFVKVWHPDRFEGQKELRNEAEEHFKQVQIAYRELGEHSRESRTPTPFNSSDRVKSFEALFVSSGFDSLVDGKRFFAASTEFPAYVHLAMSNYEDDPLIFFIDQSTLKTGGSFLAFTHNRVISKELFEHVEISYHDFAESRISIGKSRNQKPDFFDRLAAKITADTQELRLHISPSSSRMMTVGPPLFDSKLRSLYQCCTELQSRLKS
jgi:hypothetical protein